MENNSRTDQKDLESLFQRLEKIEARLSMLEKNQAKPRASEIYIKLDSEEEDEDSSRRASSEIESKIGEYGMAWLGNIVLLVGIIFLLQFFKSQDHVLLSSLFGYISIAGIYVLGYTLRKQHSYMAELFTYNGHLLLFIVTLQLHFFSSAPLISGKFFGLFLLFPVIGYLIYLAYRNRSQILTGIVMIMIVITAMASNSTHIMLALMIVVAGLSVIFLYIFGWRMLLLLAIFIVYTTFLLWFFNNPFITHAIEAVSKLQFSYIYLAICALLFSSIAILPLKDKINERQINSSIILNGLGFSMIVALISINFFKDNYYVILGIIAAVSVAFSALLQARGILKLSAALYALYGFALLSITIGGIYKFPTAFLLLSIESLLVVSMALWFRSRFIVSMNVVLVIGLLLAYAFSKSWVYSVDISFAVVALVTARIINWKKDRLEIKTELIRNIYLIMAFIMTLVSLYHAVPPNYITFSWAMAAGLFFILSIILKNMKYRWLAIAAMLSAAFYFFLIDLRQVSLGYRILALLVIAAISLSFSLFYSKKMKPRDIGDSE